MFVSIGETYDSAHNIYIDSNKHIFYVGSKNKISTR